MRPKRVTVNIGEMIVCLKAAIDKNPNSGTYMVGDQKTGALILMSMAPELNAIIKKWFDDKVLKGDAAYGSGSPPDAIKDTELQ